MGFAGDRARALLAALVLLAGDADERADEVLSALREATRERRAVRVAELMVEVDELLPLVDDRRRRKLVRETLDVVTDFEPRADADALQRDEYLAAYFAAAGVLFDEPEGGEALEDALRARHVRDWPAAQVVLLEGLGHRREPERVELFVDYLEHDDPLVARAAATALGRLADAPREVRREAVEALVDAYGEAFDAVGRETRRGRGEDAQRYLDRVEVGFDDALSKLTGMGSRDPSAWRTWFTEHGDEDDW